MAVRENEKSTDTRQQGQTPAQNRGADDTRMARRQPMLLTPFTLLDRLFNDDLLGLLRPADAAGALLQRAGGDARAQPAVWAPKIDVLQRGQELVVRADLPGVDLDDIRVDISDDAIMISGERQEERTEEDGGVYRIERSYGAFNRTIPLPEGAMADRAKATFNNGVLEVTVPAPPEQVSRGRRLDIARGDNASSNAQDSSQQGASQAGKSAPEQRER